ncbi:MAG: hypothetical protein Q7T55_05650 [Solirubrobacteraceae bacterium]|nr:hypothetical protein [Solirubrobacteraceae bacterium]
MKYRSLLAIVSAGLALGLGACADPKSSDSVRVPPKEERAAAVERAKERMGTETAGWTEVVSKICEDYRADAKVVSTKWGSKKGLSADEMVEGALADGMPLLRTLVADLRAVEVPTDVREDWDGFVESYERVVEKMPEFADEAAAGEETEEMARFYTEIGAKMVPIYEKYDLSACAPS